MQLREPVDDGQQDLFRARLEQVIDMKHPKVVLAQAMDWDCWPTRSALPARMAGAIHRCRRG